MNLHAWIVGATGLPANDVWRAYQDSAHEPLPGTDYVTYYDRDGSPQVFLPYRYDLPENPEDPVPEDVEKTTYGETPNTVTIMVFGPDRVANAVRIASAGSIEAARKALAPSVFQRVTPGTRMPQRREEKTGWTEWIQFDVIIHTVDAIVETVPTIQGSVITGRVGNMPVEVEEP